jgi:hypothetical protein
LGEERQNLQEKRRQPNFGYICPRFIRLHFKIFPAVSSWEKAGGFNMYCEASGTVIRGAMRAKECAQFFGIGESTFWRWVAKGIVPKTLWRSRA